MIIIRDDPHVIWEGALEFRLTYEGPLLAETLRSYEVRKARASHKQQIRKVFHQQLKRLWQVSPFLSGAERAEQLNHSVGRNNQSIGVIYPQNKIDDLAKRFDRFGYQFVPLATRDLEVYCSIDILFLRFGEPGHLANRMGDVDNRLKMLFDALTVPREASQVGEFITPEAGETPFFCLMEDDSLIVRASVESDTLLQPVSVPPNENDARVVISVKVRPGRVMGMNIGFVG